MEIHRFVHHFCTSLNQCCFCCDSHAASLSGHNILDSEQSQAQSHTGKNVSSHTAETQMKVGKMDPLVASKVTTCQYVAQTHTPQQKEPW